MPFSNATLDYCGVCQGDNSTCVNITLMPMQLIECVAQTLFELHHEPAATPVHWEIVAGPMFGKASINLVSGIAVYTDPVIVGYDWIVFKVTSMLNTSLMDTQNVTFMLENCTDCNGAQGGFQINDICGVCGGDGSTCLDCLGIPGGPNGPDLCGVCNGTNDCLDCFGVPYGPARLDLCGLCGGKNDTCGVAGGMSFPILVALFGFAAFGVSLWAFGGTWRTWRLTRGASRASWRRPTQRPADGYEIVRPSQTADLRPFEYGRGGYDPQTAAEGAGMAPRDLLVLRTNSQEPSFGGGGGGGNSTPPVWIAN